VYGVRYAVRTAHNFFSTALKMNQLSIFIENKNLAMKNVLAFFLLLFWSSLYAQTIEETLQISMLGEKLKSGQLSVSQVLTDPQYMALHPLTDFRNIIRGNAKAEKIRITNDQEPGLKMTVKCLMLDAAGKPVPNALVYFYQTSDKGWYSASAPHVEGNEGDFGHARLFGYVRTDAAGKFQMETIQPHGYPNSDLPAHIHLLAWTAAGEVIRGLPGELLFEEDERLTGERKASALSHGFVVAKNTGTKERAVYEYRLRAK